MRPDIRNGSQPSASSPPLGDDTIPSNALSRMKALALTVLLAGCSNPCEMAQFDLSDASMAVAMQVSDANRQAYQQAQADVRAQCGCSDAQIKVALQGVSDANVRAYREACE